MAENITAPSLTDEQIAALIAKHHVEIDRIKGLSEENRQTEMARYGLSQQALAQHYKPLAEEAKQLHEQEVSAGRKSGVVALGAAAATLIGTYFVPLKAFNDSKLIKGFFVGLSSIFALIVGGFVATRMFSGRIRDRSKAMVIEANGIFESELAIQIENSLLEKSPPLAPAMPSANLADAVGRKAPPAPRADYMAEAAKEKAALEVQGMAKA